MRTVLFVVFLQLDADHITGSLWRTRVARARKVSSRIARKREACTRDHVQARCARPSEQRASCRVVRRATWSSDCSAPVSPDHMANCLLGARSFLRFARPGAR